MILGILGLNGSGKDTVADYMVKKYGFAHEDFGQEIRDELKVLGKNHLDRNEMVVLANERRAELGGDYWAKRLIAKHPNEENLVITSIRNPVEVAFLKSKGTVLVEVFTDIKTRYARTVERVKSDPNAHGDISSFEDFKAKEERELKSMDPAKQQLLVCIESAQYRLSNNGSLEELKEKIDVLMQKLGFNKGDEGK